ncbi:MAG: FG-GAP repeat domain-containing protein [Octadecabacter sp.]
MAPRPRAWALSGLVRGAGLAACLGLAGAAAAQQITGAEFAAPTDRYPHGVLGDGLEWGSLRISVGRSVGSEDGLFSGSSDRTYSLDASEALVYEDLEPRLWDITGDGAPEVVVVQSHQQFGARLLVIGLENGVPAYLGEVPFIGTRFRWLSPVGAADFDGDGQIEVAFVDRPHLAKVLRIFEWDGTALVLDTEIGGLTNHRIGDAFISSGVRDCGDGPEMVTADGDWSDVMVTSFEGAWVSRSVGAFSASRLAATLACTP